MADDNFPAPEDRENLITSFTQFIPSSREEAQSFLQTHHWNLDDAVSAFVDNNVAASSASASTSAAAAVSNVLNPNDERLPRSWNLRINIPHPSTDDSSGNIPPESPLRIRSRSPSPLSRARNSLLSTVQPAGNIRTSGETSGGTANDSDEPMENSVGGDQSGTMVQDTQQGREDDDANDSHVLVLPLSVTLYRNGYSMNDGPFRTFDDPIDKDFVEFVERLESPREIRTRFNLVRRQNEEYHVPPFQGVGRTLGSDSVSAQPPASSPPSLVMSTAQPPASSPPSLAMSTGQPAGDIRVSSGYTTDEISSDSYEPQEIYRGGDQSGTMEQDDQESEDEDDDDTSFEEANDSHEERPLRPQVITQDLTIWRNGFSIAYVPLMAFDDQQNVDFIEDLENAEHPRECRVPISLIRRQDEDFPESPRPFTPFQGIGRTLGSASEPRPSVSLVVDPAAPTISIQLRLADGTSIVSQFNTCHTVRDILGFIDESRPDGSRDYQLLIMGVPPRPLTDLDRTIEDADISNSLLIQRY